MFWDSEISPEEEEEMIKRAAELIQTYDMDLVAIMMLETARPLVFVGGTLGRAFSSPFFMMLGDKLADEGNKFFATFDKRENVDKLITLIKKMEQEKKEAREAKRTKQKKERAKNKEPSNKKGWRKYLPF